MVGHLHSVVIGSLRTEVNFAPHLISTSASFASQTRSQVL
jgi:hypothetical protein